MTDSIMFVKETKTCHYILVINTPRLCGEPGFKSRIDQRDAALIRCRQVVDAATLANADSSLPEADHPFSQRRPPVANHPPLDAAEGLSGAGVGTDGGDASETATKPDAKDDGVGAYDHNDMLRRALEAILQKTGNPQGNDAGAGADTTPRVVVEDIGDGEMVIEFISEIEMNDEGGGDSQRRVVDDISKIMDSKVFEDALRAAGFDVRDEEVEVEVEVGTDAEGEVRNGRRTTNGAAKGRRRANAHVERDEL
jgi:protein OS-9